MHDILTSGSSHENLPDLNKKDLKSIDKSFNSTFTCDSFIEATSGLDDGDTELLINSLKKNIILSKKLAKEKFTQKSYK